MLNLLFSLFLFGLLCALSIKGIYRAWKYKEAFTAKDYALLVALSLGTLLSLYMGARNIAP